MHDFPHELPDDLKVRILGNLEMSRKSLSKKILDGEYPFVHPRVNCRPFFGKNHKKLHVKYSIEKPILLNFVDLSHTFCQILSS